MRLQARCAIYGTASGPLLFSDTPLSFWGGIDPNTGQVVDCHHPLCGQIITGAVLAIPSSRGSCTGSGILLEILLQKLAPAALIFEQPEQILTLGVLVASALFNISIPVVFLPSQNFNLLRTGKFALVEGSNLQVGDDLFARPLHISQPEFDAQKVRLSPKDKDMLTGAYGPAARTALEIVLRMAEMQGAEKLLDVSQVHVDACIYIGPASIQFAQKMADLGGKFAIPTTLNSISIDRRRWTELGIDAQLATQADRLAELYLSMGASPSFTCAPYMLQSAPKLGEQIGWAESNAVVYANSVLGARTQKYPDFLDVCIALTGRAPFSGCHRDEDRRPSLVVNLPNIKNGDDSVYPLIGYHIGKIAGSGIPIIYGLESSKPTLSDLKAFGAAFATTASAPMFHIKGITPEADKYTKHLTQLKTCDIEFSDLTACWNDLNTATDTSVQLISLGNPHFSIEEFAILSDLCSNRHKNPKVEMIITTNREVLQNITEAGYFDALERFGAEFITDTCWCMLTEPVIPKATRNIMTNSGKYAHYAPGMVQRRVHFGSLAQCVDAACKGQFTRNIPDWLRE